MSVDEILSLITRDEVGGLDFVLSLPCGSSAAHRSDVADRNMQMLGFMQFLYNYNHAVSQPNTHTSKTGNAGTC